VNCNLNFTGHYSTVGGVSGLGFADFVTGQLSAFGQGRPFYDNDKSDYYGLYAQDAWRVGPHLTINLGVRFEPYLPQRNTDGYVEAFSMSNFLAGKIGTPPVAEPGAGAAGRTHLPRRCGLPTQQPVQQPCESLAASRGNRVGSVW
jgi:outer membrane receptor protein involved in Fe transport